MEQAVREIIREKGVELPIEVYSIISQRNADKPKNLPHYHGHIEFLYANDECDVDAWIGGDLVRFRTGDLLVINSNSAHTFINYLPQNKYICIKAMPKTLYSADSSFFDMKYALPFFGNSLFVYRLFKPEELAGSDIEKYFQDALKERKDKKYGWETAVKADVLQIFSRIIRYGRGDETPHAETSASAAENARLIQKSVEFINKNFADIGEADAAAAANMSCSHYSRQFKLVMGKSFGEYLTATRINAAERMLLTTDMPITDISLETGFATSSHFIATFKKAKLTTPARYRQQWKSQA